MNSTNSTNSTNLTKLTNSHRIKTVFFFLIIAILSPVLSFSDAGAGVDLTEILNNQLVADTNNDNIPDEIRARFLIDKQTTPRDIEAAAAIAARLGFETSAMDPSLCVSGISEARKNGVNWLISFSTVKPGGSKENCGVRVFRRDGMNRIDIYGENPGARCHAAVTFFSRFPYIWDVVGKETGELWQYIKRDIRALLPESLRKDADIRMTAVHYRYIEPQHKDTEKRRLQRMGMAGTIDKKGDAERVEVELIVPDSTSPKNKNETPTGILKNLAVLHQRGEQTHRLNYAGVKTIDVHVFYGPKRKKETVTIPRIAVPQRFLNPAADPDFYRKKVTVTNSGADVANFYTTRGIYKDIDSDGIADRLASRLIYDGTMTGGTVNLAARIGLEECAVSLPFIIPATELNLETLRNLERPILLGANNRFTGYLRKIGKIDPSLKTQLKPGDGIIQYTPGFNPGGAYAVWGATPEGENAALKYLAQTLPYISTEQTQPGAPVWEDLNREIQLFFSRKNDAGTAAWGILRIDRQKNTFAAPDLEASDIKLYTMRNVDGLQDFISKRVQTYLPQKKHGQKAVKKFTVTTGGRLEPGKGFKDSYSPKWEVQDARDIFTTNVLPLMEKTFPRSTDKEMAELLIDLRLSEPLDLLQKQADWIYDSLEKAGFKKEKIAVRTVTAYKQGFHWITDSVIPWVKSNLETGDLSSIEIRFSPYPLQLKESRKYRPEPVRWLQELYPVDEILARELGVPLESIHFIKDESLTDTVYRFTVHGKDGKQVFSQSFTPFTREIKFQQRFDKWGNVTVVTGGITVTRKKDGKESMLFSKTIDTDPLRLWTHYQEKILPKLTELIQKQGGGTLKMENQPFFNKLEARIWMSEPDYRLGLDEELVSSLESFHEDYYFNTLDYFQGLIKKDPATKVENPRMAMRWAAPGNIIPIIYPSRTGQGPTMETVVKGLQTLTPKVSMSFSYKDQKKPDKVNETVKPLKKLSPPRLTGIVVDGSGNLKEARYMVEFADENQLSTAADMLRILGELQKHDILTGTFSYPDLPSIRFILTAPNRLESRFVLNMAAKPTKEMNASKSQALQPAPITGQYLEKGISKVMSPEETLEMSRRFGTLPEIDYYTGGYSYQGRPVPVLEMGLKARGKIVSRRKLTTYKPTIFIMGRQHANEVSSTNYGFKMAWLLTKDPSYRKYLEKLNIVIEPMENPDGSALAVELQKLTPHHMLHAGRYSALGTDIGYHVDKPDTLITEARVRKHIYDRWQPDIFLNNHGYPSHEWVQQFSNYTPYLFRAYWIPRGWYYFHVGLNSIGSPFHKAAGNDIVERIAQKMKGDTDVFETNRRVYDRYRRWAQRWQPHLHYMELYDGTNIYKKRRSSSAPRPNLRRDITVLEAIPEAMDETARDEWLKLSIRQGTLFITAFMDLLLDAEKPIERIEEESQNTIHLQVIRHRPVRIADRK
jgi:hypothetical protein